MKKLLPFIAALALVGQGCLAPASTPAPQETAPTSTLEAEVEHNEHEMTGVEGEAVMEDGVAVFTIDATNFAYSVSKITVQKGQKVRIKLTNSEGFHDWVVDEFNASTMRINAGEEAMVEFTPDKVGTFEFYCSVGQHRANGMVGTLVVEEADPIVEVEADAELKL
jgi:cytochrome c oxidase subunit 2